MADVRPDDNIQIHAVPVATLNLDQESFQALQEIARRRGLNDLGEALAFALSDERYIVQQLAQGRKILVKDADKIQEIDFKR